jgi:hypothetical protein
MPGVRDCEGVDDDDPVGVRDAAVVTVAVGVGCGVSAGLLPAVGLRSPGVLLVSVGVGEAETVAVEAWVGMTVGACPTGIAAPTTVSSAAAAHMIRPPRSCGDSRRSWSGL